ncbi:sensor histidine kinase [Nisaea acidiphila]|uniref:histidine kinase n=1 Tax=Nisaea acidiphila TaxID=1862145 RepID=A0A9J7B2E0_9PROT|nr:sensor histidine kinase [Nisaea acidiphila]UUX51829.1 sensor histidine kinase [Nisaea acidiphila]
MSLSWGEGFRALGRWRKVLRVTDVPEKSGTAAHERPAVDETRRRPRVSGLTLRILAINLFAVAIPLVGLLYMDRYQDSLIEAELEALTRQGSIFAKGVAALAVEPEFSEATELSKDLVRRMVRHASDQFGTRLRLFAPDGHLMADSNSFGRAGGIVQIRPLPPPEVSGVSPSRWLDRLYDLLVDWLPRGGDFPRYEEQRIQRAENYPEALDAMQGRNARAVRTMPDGGLILTTAVPVRRYKQVLGALMLSTDGAEIDKAMRDVRFEILGVFAFVFGVTILLSLYLAGTITRPVQKLAAAAERIRRDRTRETEIPGFEGRDDEIGDLARAMREMTEALWQRMDAIDRFAADVAHEIKNPLTSVRSAVETASKVQDPEKQKKLMGIILDDVQRLDRLISDISEASRLDAELSRTGTETVNLGAVLATLAEVYASTENPHGVKVQTTVNGSADLRVRGSENRLVQVIRNLVSNAITFSPEGGSVRLTAGADPVDGREVIITVEDDGPGIPENKLEAIFDRFYSERPSGEKFGTHSGLGLSISRQIVEASSGRLWAENRSGADGSVIGARFVIRLPRVMQ